MKWSLHQISAALGLSLIASVVVTVPAAASLSPVSVTPSADTYVNAQAASTYFGSSSSLGAYGTPIVTALIRFAVPQEPEGASLAEARLRVRTTALGSAGSGSAVNVRAASDSWSEATTRFANRPPVDAQVLGTLPGGTAPNTTYWIPLDTAALSQAQGSTTLALQGTSPDSFWLWSREATAATSRPLLELVYTEDGPPDITPPTAPGGLHGTVSGTSVSLTWTASNDVAVDEYTVHRSNSPSFIPTALTAVATTRQTSFVDTGRSAGTWHYRVVARDEADNESPPSNSVAVVISPSSPGQPSIRGFVASADTYVNAAAATGDFGSSTSVGVYGTPAVTAFVRFAVPAGPQGASLIGARLRVKTTTMGSAGSVNSARVHIAADTWSEATTRYATRPAVNPSVLGTLTGPTAVNTTYWIPLNTSALASLDGSLSLALQGTGADSLWVGSRESSASGARPFLELTYDSSGPPPPLDPVDPTATRTVMAAGDITCPPGTTVTTLTCKHAEVRALLDTVDPDRFIALGDLAQGTGSYSEFTVPGRFADTFGDLGDRILPVLGNHEFYTSQAQGYFDYFYGSGVTSGRIGDRPKGYYSAAIGSWRFIGLNSECDDVSLALGCDVGGQQYEWLKSLLERDSAQCTVVAYHQPRWTTGTGHSPYVGMAPMWDLLATHKVEIVLNGHNHVAEVFKPIGVSGAAAQPTLSPTGVRSFTVGIGGASQYNFTAPGAGVFSALEARARGTFGALRLELRPSGYDWGFRPIAGSTFTQSGTSGQLSGMGTCS